MRLSIRVKPNAHFTRVGGRYGDDALVVAVQAPAVDGKANAAVVRALAEAFGVRRRDVTIVHGDRVRTKIMAIDGGDDDLGRRLEELLER